MSIHYGLLDPKIAITMSGMELLQAIIAGKLPAPPIARTLNYGLVEVVPGRAVFAGTPSLDHYNPLATVHGGYIATLLDSAMGCAVHSKLPAGQTYTTLEFKVNFVRPVLDTTGEVRAEGNILHFGKRSATAEGKLVDLAGKVYAHASSTCLILG
ncbi:MAG: PaaI family thioesterase [Terriglobales bacterium]